MQIIFLCIACEHNLYFLWDSFKHIGDRQYLEIVTSSKKIMSFHDHGVVMFRFCLSRNELSRNTDLSHIKRYTGEYHPIFHRTPTTKRRMLTLLAILLIAHTTLYMISTNNMIVSRTYVMVVCIVVVISLLVYLNFKLFKICSEVRRKRATLPKKE